MLILHLRVSGGSVVRPRRMLSCTNSAHRAIASPQLALECTPKNMRFQCVRRCFGLQERESHSANCGSNPVDLPALPVELLILVVSHLDTSDLMPLRDTCIRLRWVMHGIAHDRVKQHQYRLLQACAPINWSRLSLSETVRRYHEKYSLPSSPTPTAVRHHSCTITQIYLQGKDAVQRDQKLYNSITSLAIFLFCVNMAYDDPDPLRQHLHSLRYVPKGLRWRLQRPYKGAFELCSDRDMRRFVTACFESAPVIVEDIVVACREIAERPYEGEAWLALDGPFGRPSLHDVVGSKAEIELHKVVAKHDRQFGQGVTIMVNTILGFSMPTWGKAADAALARLLDLPMPAERDCYVPNPRTARAR